MSRTITARGAVLAVALVIGSGVGAAGQTGDAPPEEFTARIVCGPQVRPGSTEAHPNRIGQRGRAWKPTIRDSTDARFDGEMTTAANSDSYLDYPGFDLFYGANRIQNENGAWQETPTVAVPWPEGAGGRGRSVFEGEGDYAGHIAIVSWPDTTCDWQIRGIILEGTLPPEPEPLILPQ